MAYRVPGPERIRKLMDTRRTSTRVVVIDNYDSFTYNLVQALETLGAVCQVFMNDGCTVASVRALAPDALLISPGPCRPEDAGVCLELLRELSPQVATLGVCLGHQAIAQAFGGTVCRAKRLLHGKADWVHHDGRTLFSGLPVPFAAGRYNSLVVSELDLPESLEISARSSAGEILAIRHRELAIEGVQFHPESILSQCGPALLSNWLESVNERND